MLSTLRVAGRQAVSRESGVRALLVGVRAGSTWANVPQGPPVSFGNSQSDL
jgi:aspartate aminotransferase